ncbi:hypothetical protein ACFYT3_32375 [Nocardia amikacinitolerans]|uniref:MmyB family transcriptional regulator n=1 Tax=Nocardia amikacinitolerans TaxID=756689 RepID=UPI00368E5101
MRGHLHAPRPDIAARRPDCSAQARIASTTTNPDGRNGERGSSTQRRNIAHSSVGEGSAIVPPARTTDTSSRNISANSRTSSGRSGRTRNAHRRARGCARTGPTAPLPCRRRTFPPPSSCSEGAAPELLAPPVNVLRLALHPEGLARRVLNLPEWGRHVTESLRGRALRSPDPELDTFIAELAGYLPEAEPGPDHLGFAVPLRLCSEEGELRLITTITSFATAVDVTLSELHLEAFLPADDATATLLRHRAGLP